MAPRSGCLPVGIPLAFHDALRVREPAGESEPLTGDNVLSTNPVRRFHLWFLRARTTLTSADALLFLFGRTPRQMHRPGCGIGPPRETELSYGDPGIYDFILGRCLPIHRDHGSVQEG